MSAGAERLPSEVWIKACGAVALLMGMAIVAGAPLLVWASSGGAMFAYLAHLSSPSWTSNVAGMTAAVFGTAALFVTLSVYALIEMGRWVL